jgi:hypothetical protein
VPLSWARQSRKELPDDIITEILTDGDGDVVNGGTRSRNVQGLVRIAPHIMRVRGNYADQELAGIGQSKIPKWLALSWYTIYKQVAIYGLVEAGTINLSFAVVWNYGSSLNLPSWVPD